MWLIECVCSAVCVLQAGDRAFQTLLQVQQRDGQLRLNHFRRVKQLGAGDVGLVDLVQLQVRGPCVIRWKLGKHRSRKQMCMLMGRGICSSWECVAVVLW